MKIQELKDDFYCWFFNTMQTTQLGANILGWWDSHITNHRSRKDIQEYQHEAWDKVWLMRSYDFEDKTPFHEEGRKGCERILTTYDDIPDNGYDDWEYGFWSGVLGTLNWILGDEEKDNLDT